MALLGAAVRFVHFALFDATLLSPVSYAADTLYLLLLSALAWRIVSINFQRRILGLMERK